MPVQALLAPSGAIVATLQGGGGNSPVDLTTYTTSGKRQQHVVAQFGLPQYSRSGIQLLAWSADSTLVALTAVKLSTAGSEEELLVVNTGSGAVSTIAAGNIVGEFLATFVAYPPSQASGTLSVEKALAMLQEGTLKN